MQNPEERGEYQGEQSYEQAWEKTRQGVRAIRDQASQSLETARQKLREGARSVVVEQKGRTVSGLRRLSQAIHDTANKLQNEGDRTLAEYADAVGSQVERAAGYLDEREPAAVLQDFEAFARRQAGLFVGGMFVAGLIVARLLRSAPRSPSESAGEPSGESTMLPEPQAGQPSAIESTYVPPSSRFGASGTGSSQP
jgi:hypothetical protein